jgi:pSer/pThr/pTyr-binding forkhead associated (FHA) protein
MPVGRRAARSGILLGRSDRCDGEVLLSNPHISRVHALIVEMAGSLYAIDTASKNGVWGHGGEERAQLLESGATFSLCGLASIEWRFFH